MQEIIHSGSHFISLLTGVLFKVTRLVNDTFSRRIILLRLFLHNRKLRIELKEAVQLSLLQVSNLTFCYEGNSDNVFENVSFSIDTDWKTGFIGRNGKGKTTFLNLLLGKMD